MNYLHDGQHYIDRYDLSTIEECLDYYWSIKDGFIKERTTRFAKYSEERFQQEVEKCLSRLLFVLKTKRYQHKKETIQEWMDRDRHMQELYDNTSPPQNIKCSECGSPTTVTFKDLHDSYEANACMVFMFECTKCKKRQALYEDGTEWKYDPPKCPKCKHPLETDLKIKGDITTFISKCPKCEYKDKDVDDHNKFRLEQEAKDKREKELLEKYRDDFCLSDKDGQEHIETLEAMEVAAVVREEEMQKYASPVYERSLQLKKTTIADLEKLLTEALEKAKYTKLIFEKPEIGQYVMVPFTTQDLDSSRKDRASSSELEKVIETALEDTNWRLLSNSVLYRLGYLQGQLKGYEQEEDMLKLAGQKEEPKPKSKIDEAKRQKYASNNLVQLSKMLGEFDGVENMRKRRLEKEPDGFVLNDSGRGYTCGICGESIEGDKTWWDLRGIRCLDCQRNVKAGIVPPEIFEDEDYGYDLVVKDNQLGWDYGIHSATVRKLCRQGELKGRELKSENGTVYKTLFVVSENKEFFEKHPKKESKIKVTFSSSNEK